MRGCVYRYSREFIEEETHGAAVIVRCACVCACNALALIRCQEQHAANQPTHHCARMLIELLRS